MMTIFVNAPTCRSSVFVVNIILPIIIIKQSEYIHLGDEHWLVQEGRENVTWSYSKKGHKKNRFQSQRLKAVVFWLRKIVSYRP